ncbi:hypothetical protein CAP35_03170 [Chitinophagaceae bacterium IBVUCB1]|nr:hypothetical protein CAP35_03170 [Chitinophagaceae bacterium IBVUCB1]
MYEIFNYKGIKTLGINLRRIQLLILGLLELILFLLMIISYQDEYNVANDFYWENMYVFPRGIFPIILLEFLSDSMFPINSIPLLKYLILLFAWITDYVILLMLSIIKNFMTNKDVV